MKLLAAETAELDALLPGLREQVSSLAFAEREKPGNPCVEQFKQSGGPGLLIPRKWGGRGSTALAAVRIQRALGSLAPSLAIASTMHHFSVATLVETARASASGLERLLLEGIARQNLLVASGFAEGRPAQGILSPAMTATAVEGGFVVDGVKKPCSLSRSMDLLTACVEVRTQSGEREGVGIALIPRRLEGIHHRPFWNNWVLAGAESDELVLEGVKIEKDLLFLLDERDPSDPMQVAGFLWFELLISASYLGMASALVQLVVARDKGPACDRALLGIELEGAMASLEAMAWTLDQTSAGPDDLGRMLFVRFSVQRAIERSTQLAAELLGGMSFIASADASYLLAASRGLAFHPPSRSSFEEDLAGLLTGRQFSIR